MSVQEEESVPHEEEEQAVEEAVEEEQEGAAVEEAAEEAGDGGGKKGLYTATEVNDQIFEELDLGSSVASEVQTAWTTLLRSAESREAAGEAIYSALFDAAPSLQSLFKTPRAVMAMRFMNGLNNIIGSLGDPKACKVVVETLGFQHLDLEVTPPRVVIFRDAICDLLSVELGARFTKKANEGWRTFLNYVGGSYIYVRTKFAVRLKILESSWATANNRTVGEGEEGEEAAAAEGAKENEEGGEEGAEAKEAGEEGAEGDKERGAGGGGNADMSNNQVPTSYKDMFMFNAAVMGYRQSGWMSEVLTSFDAIVTNVANSYRLQEECDVLSLRLAKYKGGNINLPEYKAVMLASLRSLVPKDWDSNHEVAWTWLWENVQRMLQALIGKPQVQEKALGKLWASLDEKAQMFVRREVYAKFFAIAPAGQDYFKQSTTRLHFIADRVVVMSLDMYQEPKRMVEDISALGLRHVGYGIPTDLFGAFVTGCVEVVRLLTNDEMAEDAFRWSLNLISRILTRVINEGSTIVMKAINANSSKMLKKAVGCAPRGKRALWMLNIQVGTQSISPLLWAIETGALEAAQAMVVDLLTIRADRERYYYGMDTMFERHADIIRVLCADARGLLPILFDGLVWRSRVTENGLRRVNYYFKHLLVTATGGFNEAIEWITDTGDPKIVCHPVIAMVTDLVWTKVALRSFVFGKLWFIFTLIVFVCSQSILNRLDTDSEAEVDATNDEDDGADLRLAILIGRAFIYVCSMGQQIYRHGRQCTQDIRNNELVKVGRLRVPGYLTQWQGVVGLFLTLCLVVMLCLEPILHCMASGHSGFYERCKESEHLTFAYSVISAIGMFLYFLLLIDLAVLNTRISAFVLVCNRLLSEVALFLCGLTFFAAACAAAASTLDQEDGNFAGIPTSGLTLIKITFGMLNGTDYTKLHDFPVLFVLVTFFIIATVVFLLNLLIAQLNCAYQATYLDMLGYARLNRGKIVTDTMASVPASRWQSFLGTMKLDERVEFGEGDLGLAGGIQIWETATLNITTVDMIRRFGGSTSMAAQWPEEAGDDEDDQLDRIEKLVEKAIKRMDSRGKKGKAGGNSAGGSSDQGGQESGSAHDSGGGGSE